MAELDQETLERAVRWCAEAGRQATPGEVRAALASLGWDELLAVRALLADPPPARPLGPHALADLARGVPSDVAAEREREARYPRPGAGTPATGGSTPPSPPPSVPLSPTPRKRAGGARRPAPVVVRKAASLLATPPPRPPPRPPLLEELLLPPGRAALTQLIRVHGGRRPRLVAAIAASHRRADGAPIGDADLDGVLEHHGLERTYTRRERDELLHAVRAAGGLLARAAAALGHQPDALAAAITRLGLDAEVRRLRESRRRDLRTRATLSERAQLLVGSTDTLADLELLEEFERDLTLRLPGHLRALSTTGEPLELGLARTLGLPGATVAALMARLQVDLRAPAIRPPAPAGAAAAGSTSRPPRRPDAGSAGRAFKKPPPPLRPSGSRPSGSRPSGSRPSGSRPPGSRPSGPRLPGARPGPPRRPGQGGGRRGPGR